MPVVGLLQLLFASLIAGARFAGVKTVAFQAIAHCYVGGLYGAFIRDYRIATINGRQTTPAGDGCLLLAIGLTICEIVAVVVSLFR